MKKRRLLFWSATAGAAALAVLLVVWGFVRQERGRRPTGGNTLGNPPGMVDRLLMLDTADAWAAGEAAGVEVAPPSLAAPAVVRLAGGEPQQYPRSGAWTSPVYDTAFPFTELIPSYNAHAPPDTGLRLEVQVRHGRGPADEWSPWLYLGSWGRTSAPPERVTGYPRGFVNIDYLALDRPADAFRVRVHLESFAADPHVGPALRRLCVSYSGVVDDPAERARLRPPLPAEVRNWSGDLPVPFRTQQDAPPAFRGEICSPTSVSMVMAYWGVERPTLDNAVAIYDAEAGIFGNWGRAVAWAGECGLDAWLARFRDWDSVKAELSRGRPVVASIRFGAGEFPSAAAVLPETDGHLIVIRGFTPSGDVIVNDPASRDHGNGVVYKADELAKAWFDHGGVGYVIAAAGRPAADRPPPRPGPAVTAPAPAAAAAPLR